MKIRRGTIFWMLIFVVALVQLFRTWFNFSPEVGWILIGMGWVAVFLTAWIGDMDKKKN